MTERSTGLPSPQKVIELLDGEFARAGFEIEDVSVDARTRPPRITVVVDGDRPLDLDSIAELSRSASEVLDAEPGDTEYLLEVSSPGVERPLTTEKHFRRARGRRIDVELADGSQLTGRAGGVENGALRLVIRERSDWVVREIPLTDLSKAVVQVEFSSPNKREIELAGHGADAAAGREAGA